MQNSEKDLDAFYGISLLDMNFTQNGRKSLTGQFPSKHYLVSVSICLHLFIGYSYLQGRPETLEALE